MNTTPDATPYDRTYQHQPPRKICPFMVGKKGWLGYCLRDDCALFDDGSCSIFTLSRAIQKLSFHVQFEKLHIEGR